MEKAALAVEEPNISVRIAGAGDAQGRGDYVHHVLGRRVRPNELIVGK